MAKNKHQKLATLMKIMLSEINHFLDDCQKLGSRYYEVKHRYVKAPGGDSHWRIDIIESVLKSKVFDRNANFLKILLYCPSKNEFSNEINWYENEQEADSFSYQVRSIHEWFRRDELIRQNLLKDPFPIYQKAIQIWRNDATKNPYEHVANNPQNLMSSLFAPVEGQTLALSYERLLKSKNEQSRFREKLRMIYKEELESEMFQGIPNDDPIRYSFLREWEYNLKLKTPTKGNEEDFVAIDHFTASRIIEQFVKEFIDTPSQPILGEIACVLWILTWSAKESEVNNIKLKQIINLKTNEINFHQNELKIKSKNKEICIEISERIYSFVLCLMPQNTGKRTRRIFENIPVDMKSFERHLKRVCDILSIKPDVSPKSFLISTHPYKGERLTATHRYVMQNPRKLIKSSVGLMRTKIKKMLKCVK